MKPHLPDFYDSNLSLLKKHHPNVWKTMTESPPDPVGEVFLSTNGKINLRVVNGEGKVVDLHNPADPEIDEHQFLKIVPENSTGFVTLLGMGLGYNPIALLQQRPQIRNLAIFELEPSIFRHALQYMDLSPLLSDPRLMLSVSRNPDVPGVFAPVARAIKTENTHILKHPPSFSFDNTAYQELSDKVFECLNQFNVSGGTVLRRGSAFFANRLGHLSFIHHNFLLESLQAAFSGTPAILVSAGPSLDKNIHLLPLAKERAVIIAVDTVLPALLAHGVSPDFVASIDPYDLTYEKIAGVASKTKGVSLICSSWVAPKVPKIFPAERVFWCFSGTHIEKWINTLLGGKILTPGATTAAHLNLTAAIIMGCSPIIFVGQDLAYTASTSHAEHTVLSNRDLMNNILKSKSENDIVWTDGINGDRVPTSRSFYSMIKHFEQTMTHNPGHYINATEGGAHLEGTEVLALKEAIDLYCSKPNDISDRVGACSEDSGLADNERMLSEFRIILKQVKNLQKTIRKADLLTHAVCDELSNLQKAGAKCRSFSALSRPLQKRVKEIEACQKKLDSDTRIWKLLEEITMEGLRQSERMLHEIRKIEGKPEKYMEWLLKNLERFDYINSVHTKTLATFEEGLSGTLDNCKKEKKFLKDQNLLKLARLYFESGHIVLAKPALEKLIAVTPDSAEVNFYLGCIAAHRTEYEKAEECFMKAVQVDPGFEQRLEKFRQQLGDDYFGYAEYFRRKDRNTFKRMLFKGLRYCPDHAKTIKELGALTAQDLREIEFALISDIHPKDQDTDALIRTWHKELEENKSLASCLTAEQMAGLHRFYGILLASEKDFAGAVESFKKAMAHSPNTPELHILIADVFFAQGDFTRAVKHINKAVEIDRTCAEYWENMGDYLQEAGQTSDAILAYEQCFMALPENIGLLKKIGDCYLTMDQIEAAREAYSQLLKKTSELEA